MAIAVILVNGRAGAVQSAVAVKLAVLLGCPVLSRAAVSESLAELTGDMVRAGILDSIAMNTVWALAAAVQDGAVIDSDWASPADTEAVKRGIAICGASRVVELLCDQSAEPLGPWPHVRADVTGELDWDALLPELATHLL